MTDKEVRVIVACVNASGQSDLVPLLASCTVEQIENAEHTQAAQDYLLTLDYEPPMVPFDITDSHWGMFRLSGWGDDDMVHIDISRGRQW